jgi:hypothetical protein
MSDLDLTTEEGRTAFKPGERLSGRASWQVDDMPASAEVRLFWYTRGKGTEDVEIVHTIPFGSPQKEDRREFTLTLPSQPYSFSGKLISLIWALELIVEPGSNVERLDLVVSPHGREVVIHRESA